MLARIPVGRVGSIHDIAHPVRFLCHPDSGIITGEVLIRIALQNHVVGEERGKLQCIASDARSSVRRQWNVCFMIRAVLLREEQIALHNGVDEGAEAVVAGFRLLEDAGDCAAVGVVRLGAGGIHEELADHVRGEGIGVAQDN